MSRIATDAPRAVWCCSTCGAIYHRDYPRCPADGAEVVMADRDPLLGTAVGHYRIDHLIGEGGMGRVYLAHHANLPNKRYAFKVLLGDHAASMAMRQRFTREAERASQLDHPNVVRVVDFGQTQHGLLYIVMDYVDGPSLVSLIDTLPMPPIQAVALAREICKGLTYAHDAGIVHRDLKPENILVATGPAGLVPRIVDFGLALSIDQSDARLTESGMTMGTPLFAAPEQLLGKPLDHRADLFALGMTMFEMLTGGMTPIDGHLMEVVASKTTKDTPRISERAPELAIPAELDELVARLTRRKPADRYASAADVIDALDRLRLGRGSGKRANKAVAAARASASPAREAAGRREISIPNMAGAGDLAGPQARIPTHEIAMTPRAARRGWGAAGVVAACGVAGAMWLASARGGASSPPAPVPPVVASLPPVVALAVPAAEIDMPGEPPAGPAPRRSPPRAPSAASSGSRTPRPAGAAARVGQAMRAKLDRVDVRGSLPAGTVQRAIERSWPSIAGCTPSAPGTVVAHFTIGEARRARGVRAAGSTPATSTCVAATMTAVRTEAAPDIGDVEVTVQIAFVGTIVNLRLAALVLAATTANARADPARTIAGSVQLDYLAVPGDRGIHATTFDGMTAELSLKMSVDFTRNASVSVKVCFACHGFEAAAAYVDLRAADELRVRVGRLTPEFGSFPQRGDPANHRTNDKPLPYDMGRMLHHTDWNEGILPAPWVDNGVELLGTRFVDGGRLDYAAYVLSGPRGNADAADLEFAASRDGDRSYVDNNSEPVVGARLAGTLDLGSDGHGIALGASAMAGHYDPDRRLGFWIAGGDVVANLGAVVLRGEYLVRQTDMAVGDMPALRWKFGPDAAGRFDDHFTKHGFYGEAELPIGRFDAFARFDGLLRTGNVLRGSALSDRSSILRYTVGTAARIIDNIRIKASIEYYQFNDLANEVALHLGIATPF